MDVVISVPPTQFFTQSPDEVADTIKTYAALGMYQAGVISIGAACEFAEVSVYDFHELLKRNNIPIMTQSADEFAEEWRSANP